MAGPDPAVAAIRSAVRASLGRVALPVRVACSGGADSLALAAALAFEAERAGLPVAGWTVDHGLQPGSAEQAERAAEQLTELGCAPVLVLSAAVGHDGGPEGAARTARYRALRVAAEDRGTVALGHTRDDQAESVLLGLGRGSGPRSIAGMRPFSPDSGEPAAGRGGLTWWRPILGITRAETVQACAAQGLTPWHDPHNADPAYRRVRLRTEVLPLLDEVLAGGTAAALARTAELVRADNDALDDLADRWLAEHSAVAGIDVSRLSDVPKALARRVVRAWLLASGVGELRHEHLDDGEALVHDWHGQGAVDLPGGFALRRVSGTLVLHPPGPAAHDT